MFARAIERNAEVLSSTRGFVLCVGLFMLWLFAFRGFAFPAASGDGAEQLLFSQSFAWGYDLRNPPLYTWLVIASQQVFGVTIHSVAFVKFTAMFGMYLFLRQGALGVLGEGRLAAIAALSPLALYLIAWDSVMNYSQTVLVAAMVPATFCALMRLDAKPTLASYAILGLAVGIGLLSKYTYALFILSLLAAGMMDGGLRARLVSAKALLALALAALIVLPHLIWYLDNTAAFTALVQSKFTFARGPDALPAPLLGLGAVITAFFNASAPLIFLLPLFFWRGFAPLRGATAPSARTRRIIGASLIIMTVATVVLVLGAEVTRLRTHYMVLFILFPIYFFARVQAGGVSGKATARYGGLLTALAVIVAAAVPAIYVAEPLRCKRCTLMVPYAALAERLREAGFTRGKIISWYLPVFVSGNLRVHFPDSAVASAKYPVYDPPGLKAPGPCLVIWETNRHSGVKERMLDEARKRLGAVITGDEPVGKITLALSAARKDKFQYAFMLVPPGQGTCT
jgi:4-amino-4-deoxy-L-arabinose transferase-like glycosyltransferase